MTGGLGRGLRVQDMHAAVHRGHLRHHVRCHLGAGSHERGHQAASPTRGQGHGLVQLVVGHQRAHGAEGLHVVHGRVRPRIAAQQQRRAKEGALGHALADGRESGAQAPAGIGAKHHFVAAREQRHALGHVGLLRPGGQRAHLHAFHGRITHHGLGQARGESFRHGVHVPARHDGAADGGAFLPGLGRHLARHFLHEQLEGLVIRPHLGRQHRAVQRIGLGVEGNGARHQVGVHSQAGGRVGRAGESDHVGLGEAVQQVPRAADDELQAAWGQQAGVVDHAHHRFGEVAGGRGRLADAGHARQEAGCELLQQAPDGEVEGVDVHRHPAPRHQDVRAREHTRLAQGHRRALMHHVARGQVARAHTGIGEQRAGAALDVDPAVGARGAGVAREGVERLLSLQQVRRQRLQHGGALLEVQLQQRGDAHRAGVVHGFGEGQGLGMGVCHSAAVDGAAQQAGGFGANPAVSDQALQDGDGHHGADSSVRTRGARADCHECARWAMGALCGLSK